MIRKSDEKKVTVNERLRGGEGTVVMSAILEPDKDELYGHGRLYSLITLSPGSSIGYHVHDGEMEAYYFLSGTAEYNDNGEITTVGAGDVTLTKSGEGHSVKNIGGEDVHFVALILSKPE